jgi:hypothetical protein
MLGLSRYREKYIKIDDYTDSGDNIDCEDNIDINEQQL